MSRVTRAQLDSALERYVRALKSAGLGEFADVEMREGSPSNGVSWSLMLRNSTERPIGGGSFGHLGWTRREAFETLHTVTQTIVDIRDSRG